MNVLLVTLVSSKQGGTDQKVVEANLLLFQEDEYGEGVAADAENSEYEHEEACTIYGGQGAGGVTYEEGVVLEDVSRVDCCHVLIRGIATILVVLNLSHWLLLHRNTKIQKYRNTEN